MNLKDLKIGNIVAVNGNPVTISQIGANWVGFKDNFVEVIQEVFPIPIDETLLFALGYHNINETDNHAAYKNAEGVYIYRHKSWHPEENEDYYIHTDYNKRFWFVHELQNILPGDNQLHELLAICLGIKR